MSDSRFEVLFLGTGNASGIPSPFCSCDICKEALMQKNKNFRTRSSVLINDNILIDVSPDIMYQCVRESIDLLDLEHILITHTHSDHFSVQELFHSAITKSMEFNQMCIMLSKQAFKNYLDMTAHASLNSYMKQGHNHQIIFKELGLETTYEIETFNVIPILSTHHVKDDEYAYNYIISKEDKYLLYGTDTGFYSHKTVNFLKNFKFNVMVLDSNHNMSKGNHQHMGISDIVRLLDVFYENGTIDQNTTCYLTHISHIGSKNHDALNEALKSYDKCKVIMAYDGLKFTL